MRDELHGEDFHWATGWQAPSLLQDIIIEIDMACQPDAASKPRPVIRLADRKPHDLFFR
jgi:hypothetical protein